ncbi:MAG: replicative helicase [Patescibacteria group bacterium]|nr:replicative helicase [Patescibacteria group bacterium]
MAEEYKNRKYDNNYDRKKRNDSSPFDGLRLPPQDIDSEKALLGAIIINPEAWYEVEDNITDKTFYSEKHRIIWRAMSDLTNAKEPVDLITLNNKLKEKKDLDIVGGSNYLAELSAFVPSSSNIKYYANNLKKKELLRRLIESGTKITDISYEEQEELESILEMAEKEIYNITTNNNSNINIVQSENLSEDFLDRFEKIREHSGNRGVPTGLPSLDRKLSGFQKTDLIILAARPSVGKSSLMLDFARSAAVKHSYPTVIFSLEMGKEQLFDRMLAAQSKIDGWKLRTGKISMEEDLERLQQGLNDLGKAPIYIDDTAGITITSIRSTLRRIKSEKPLGLVIVDYLQLMNTTRNYDNMVHQIGEISKSLKQLAKEFDVPVIALSQLSRSVEQRRDEPKLSDLRDSGSIEQDADIVLFLHRDDAQNSKRERGEAFQIDLLISKHRNGETGRVKLLFDGKSTSFTEIADDGFSDIKIPEININLDSNS